MSWFSFPLFFSCRGQHCWLPANVKAQETTTFIQSIFVQQDMQRLWAKAIKEQEKHDYNSNKKWILRSFQNWQEAFCCVVRLTILWCCFSTFCSPVVGTFQVGLCRFQVGFKVAFQVAFQVGLCWSRLRLTGKESLHCLLLRRGPFNIGGHLLRDWWSRFSGEVWCLILWFLLSECYQKLFFLAH